MYGAYRPAGPDNWVWRISQFLFPFHAHISGMMLRSWVPMDDTHTMYFSVGKTGTVVGPTELTPNGTGWFDRFRPVANVANDYTLDRASQRSQAETPTGIEYNHDQDKAVTESMGGILDRTIEHVGTTDAMILRIRNRLIEAARMLAEHKATPPGVDDPDVFRTRSAGLIMRPRGDDLVASLLAAGEELATAGPPFGSPRR